MQVRLRLSTPRNGLLLRSCGPCWLLAQKCHAPFYGGAEKAARVICVKFSKIDWGSGRNCFFMKLF